MKFYEAGLGDTIKIIGGLKAGCVSIPSYKGKIISKKDYDLSSKFKHGWETTWHALETIGYFESEKYVIAINNDCLIEVVEKAVTKKKSRKRAEDIKEKDMKDFKIVDYKTYENRVVIVKFDDNTEEKAVCCDTDEFDLETGVSVCVFKHILGENEYKSMLRKAMKQIKAVDKAKDEKKKNDEAAARRKAKNAKRKARHKENRRNRRIAEMKEAYLAAMREHNGNISYEFESDYEK